MAQCCRRRQAYRLAPAETDAVICGSEEQGARDNHNCLDLLNPSELALAAEESY